MKRIALALAMFIGACGPPAAAPPAEAPLVIAPLGKQPPIAGTLPNVAEGPLDLAAFVASADVQSVTEAHSAAFLNVVAVRQHALGSRIREIVRAKAQGMDLVDDVDFVLWVGPDLVHSERGVILVGVRPGADVQWNIERMMRGSSSSRAPRAESVDIEGVRGWRTPGDRVALRLRDDLVVIARDAQAPAAVRAFRKRLPGVPSPREIVGFYGRGDGAHLGGLIPGGGSVEDLRFVIESRGDGAELRLDARCPDAANAKQLAQTLTSGIALMNASGVQTVTKGLFDDAKVNANGEAVSLVVVAENRHLVGIVDALDALPP